jgi:hypothetical protein
MAIQPQAIPVQPTAETRTTRFLTPLQIDRVSVGIAAVIILGACLDGWAHNHNKVDNSFFTPWHAVLYSGFLLMTAFLAIVVIGRYREIKGTQAAWSEERRAWKRETQAIWRAIPAGYHLSLLGVVLFGAAGAGDMVWHNLFGFETGVEPLLSPTHLVLATGVTLIMSGPFRAAWQRPGAAVAPWTAIFSWLLTLSIVTFMGQFAHPFVHAWAGQEFNPGYNWDLLLIGQVAGVTSILLQSGLLIGFILLLIYRWQSLPFGSFTLFFAINMTLMSGMRDEYRFVPVAVLGGLAADLLYRWLKPSRERPNSLRLFAFFVPANLYALYFLTIHLTEGIWWTIHLWAGCIILAGVAGLMLSYLFVPPVVPE